MKQSTCNRCERFRTHLHHIVRELHHRSQRQVLSSALQRQVARPRLSKGMCKSRCTGASWTKNRIAIDRWGRASLGRSVKTTAAKDTKGPHQFCGRAMRAATSGFGDDVVPRMWDTTSRPTYSPSY